MSEQKSLEFRFAWLAGCDTVEQLQEAWQKRSAQYETEVKVLRERLESTGALKDQDFQTYQRKLQQLQNDR